MRDFLAFRRLLLTLALCSLLWTLPALSQDTSRLDQVLDAIVANERDLAQELKQYRPLVETYLQTVKPDTALGTVPIKDAYFFGRLALPDDQAVAADGKKKKTRRSNKKSLTLFDDYHSQIFKPEHFAQMLILDRDGFSRENYHLEFIRPEFLGEIRTLVFDVTPQPGKVLKRLGNGRFTGRIWVEDEGYKIVRFNGIYTSVLNAGFHFDSWRLNMAPGLWLPAYVYTEESERAVKHAKLTHKGQTRIWGYKLNRSDPDDDFTKVLIDAPQTRDQSESPGRISPVESARAWESEAEDNVIQRLARVGLLAPPGEVDKVLDTVVLNLEITNSLDIQPPVSCRVLLTTPLESFTVGHTIVISRGLIDVLPDEASLATVLAHEMGHVLSGHKLDTSYAFSDRVLIGDKEAMQQFAFERNPAEELQADDKALELLANSPYKDDLEGAGLFLKALDARAQALPALIRPHFGSRMTNSYQPYRMAPIVDAAPELDPMSLEQTAALPLGGRVKLDPWSARIELMKNNRVPLLSAREKMPFQVTPLMPYLTRYDSQSNREVAESGQGNTLASDRHRESN